MEAQDECTKCGARVKVPRHGYEEDADRARAARDATEPQRECQSQPGDDMRPRHDARCEKNHDGRDDPGAAFRVLVRAGAHENE